VIKIGDVISYINKETYKVYLDFNEGEESNIITSDDAHFVNAVLQWYYTYDRLAYRQKVDYDINYSPIASYWVGDDFNEKYMITSVIARYFDKDGNECSVKFIPDIEMLNKSELLFTLGKDISLQVKHTVERLYDFWNEHN
jgi:hypothetical protein